MSVSRTGTAALFGSVAITVLFLDLVTKYLIGNFMQLGTRVELVPGLLDLVHARNPGAAFGLMSRSPWEFRSVFLVAVSVAALIVILWLVVSAGGNSRLLVAGYGFFFGGALGNLVDRVRHGEVIDFLDFYLGSFHWPAFNVADSALCVGAGLFVLQLILEKRKSEPHPRPHS